ncbi:MAG: type II secretion protein F, partial [Alphaproteobacteria bacterium]
MVLSPAIIAMILVLTVGILLAVIIGRIQDKKKHMYSIVTGRSESSGPRDSKDKKLAQQRAEIAKKLKESSDENKKEKKKREGSLKFLIQQAGFVTPIWKFYLYSLIFALAFFGLISLTSWSGLVKSLLLFTAFFGMPRFFLKFKAKRRQKQFLEDFADALDAIVRMLQAGMPVSEAISMAAQEFGGPLGLEMSHIYDDQKVGIPMGEAAARASERMPLTEMKMFATAIQIQSETGSSLSEVLTNLSGVIRARFRLQRKVQA